MGLFDQSATIFASNRDFSRIMVSSHTGNGSPNNGRAIRECNKLHDFSAIQLANR